MTAMEVIDQHIPSLTDENAAEIASNAVDFYAFTEGADLADLAIRTCRCGVRIDGFYEYAAHLKGELRKAATS